MRQKIELIEQELGRWRTGEAVPPSEQTALGEELPLCDQVTQRNQRLISEVVQSRRRPLLNCEYRL